MGDAVLDFRAAILDAMPGAAVPDHIDPDRLHRFPTNGKRCDSAGWCKLFGDRRGGVFGDFRAGLSRTWAADDQRMLTPAEREQLRQQVAKAAAEREAQQRIAWRENGRRIAALWRECSPLQPGDPVTLYLKRRGFAGLWPLPACLRYHQRLRYWHEDGTTTEHPGMVAPLLASDGSLVALHRTYLTRDGGKAMVPEVRKLTPAAGPMGGACIALHRPAAGALGIAEGIETALGAWCASGVPVVAAYSAGNLATWRWPDGVRRIVIFADNDEAGLTAADRLRARAIRHHLPVEVLSPTDPGADWCDVWAQRGQEVTA